MGLDLDSYLGVHVAALQLREKRTELLAQNLANADTPGYKARDLDFQSALARVSATGATGATGTTGAAPGVLRATQPGHVGIGDAAAGDATAMTGSTESYLRYRTPLAPSLDGNTVDAQLEQAAFARNTVNYQATLSFLGAKFRGLMTAITGQ